jgi:hypothetical protein
MWTFQVMSQNVHAPGICKPYRQKQVQLSDNLIINLYSMLGSSYRW